MAIGFNKRYFLRVTVGGVFDIFDAEKRYDFVSGYLRKVTLFRDFIWVQLQDDLQIQYCIELPKDNVYTTLFIQCMHKIDVGVELMFAPACIMHEDMLLKEGRLVEDWQLALRVKELNKRVPLRFPI